MYPISKYRFYETTTKDGAKKIIAVSTYAGKTVRGTAICHPDDEFNLDKGKQIAAARCAARIAEKRANRAWQKQIEAYDAWVAAEQHYDAMVNYHCDAENALYEVNDYLDSLLNEV